MRRTFKFNRDMKSPRIRGWVSLFFTISLLVGSWAFSQPTIKTFREWKNDKVQEALGRLKASKSFSSPRASRPKTEAGLSKEIDLEQYESQLRSDLLVLEMARDLTVTDYFVGYVNKYYNKPQSFKAIATRMNHDEVAELMMAYSNSIFSSTAKPKMAIEATNQNPGSVK